jgi:release factor glutamine methyltransferase
MFLLRCGAVKLDPTIRIEALPQVYAPAEDSFLLLSTVKVGKGQRVLEMGCGTGIIALHCAKAGCYVTATDISLGAADNARMNASNNDLEMEVVQSDLFDNVAGEFDVIIFNPPYLSSEDAHALSGQEKMPRVGGEKGHEVSVRFLEQAVRHLAKAGKIYLLTSSESETGVLDEARRRFAMKKIAEERLFFETLAVWELEMGNA